MGDDDGGWSWGLTPNGLFNSASLRRALDDMNLRRGGPPTMWIKIVPLKGRLFIWRAWLHRLPTKDNLAKRGIQLPNHSCVLCNEGSENGDHILTCCRKEREVRSVVNCWANLLPVNSATVSDFLEDICRKNQTNRPNSIKEVIGLAYLWAMWLARNDVFSGKRSSMPRERRIVYNL